MIGLAQYGINPVANRSEKEKTYEVCRRFKRALGECNGFTLCSELLGFSLCPPEGPAEACWEVFIQSR